jgi:hypothetical protein
MLLVMRYKTNCEGVQYNFMDLACMNLYDTKAHTPSPLLGVSEKCSIDREKQRISSLGL